MQARDRLDGAAPPGKRPRECQHLYLAQAPLTGGLAALHRDVPPPPALRNAAISSTNVWLNRGAACSSLHYDPRHNLLCTLTGAKTVHLWPPSCGAALHPHSPFGESPNHSGLSGVATGGDARLAAATAAAERSDLRFSVTLAPGDALFIPAGWWHLVRSAPATAAVNYWWEPWVDPRAAPAAHMAPFWRRQAAQQRAAAAVSAALLQLRAWCRRTLSKEREAAVPSTAAARSPAREREAGARSVSTGGASAAESALDRSAHATAAASPACCPEHAARLGTAARLRAAAALLTAHIHAVSGGSLLQRRDLIKSTQQ